MRQKLIKAFDEQIPDQFAEILLKCPKLNKERKIIMNTKKQKNLWFIPLTITALLLIVISTGLFYNYNTNYKIDSIIDIDVNPSIELQINKKEKIVKYRALNSDAEKILDDMDLKNVDIDIALNAIIGSMVTKGYINDIANSILVSVDNNDVKKAEELRLKLANKIDSIISNSQFQGSVLSQAITEQNNDEDLKKAQRLADQYDISLGKAKLIIDILKQNSKLTEQDLVSLSVNEINLLTQSKNNQLSSLDKYGNASTKAYISTEAAQDKALKHAGVTKYTWIETEFDADDGIMVYDVEFATTTFEYDYEINALTGEVIKFEKEQLTNNNQQTATPNHTNTNYISQEEAKNIALKHASVTNPQRLKIELDREDREYSIEFIYNNQEYDYEIDALSGQILEYDIEPLDYD